MSTSTPAAPRNGLLNVADVIVAPATAFERLRVVPTWGWAFLVAALLGVAGLLLMMPAQMHAFDQYGPALYASQDAVKKLPADKQQEMIAKMMSFGKMGLQFSWIFAPIIFLIGALLQTVIMLIGNAIGKGDGTFKRLWAVAVNVSIIGGIGLLLTGLIALVRGPAAFDTPSAVQFALPSLALLAPGAPVKLGAFLGTISITSLWSTYLIATGMGIVARVPRAVAWITAVVGLLLAACLAAAFAQG